MNGSPGRDNDGGDGGREDVTNEVSGLGGCHHVVPSLSSVNFFLPPSPFAAAAATAAAALFASLLR